MTAHKSMAADVLQFMLAFQQFPAPLQDFQRTPQATKDLATMLMFGDGTGFKQGEVKEMQTAWNNFCASQTFEHLTEFVDGAIDSIYVILWTLNKLGVPVEECWQEVQRSNRSKLGPDGKPIICGDTGKVKKPEGWTPPDLFGILTAHACEVTYRGGIAMHPATPKE